MNDRIHSRPVVRRPWDRKVAAPRPRRARLNLEALEDRAVPAVITVNSLADILNPNPGVVTLRSAIQKANTDGDATNTINLAVAGTYKITLPGTPGETDNAAGEFAILPSAGNVSIVNTSGGRVTVDGNYLSRVFDINPGLVATKFLVTMQGFTITHGVAFDTANFDGPNSSGGGIRDQGMASLTLTNMLITNNTASADGGGVSMENTVSVPWTLTVNNSVISYNHAGDAGGGIDEDGAGKVFINAGTVITGNTCVNQGAGVWLDAIGVDSATLTITGALFSYNTSINGNTGAIGNAGSSTVTINNSTVEYNFSGTTGGGFGDENNLGSLTVFNSVFLGNSALGTGGGIQEGGPSTLIANTLFQGNTAGGDGGGVFDDGGQLLLENCTFVGNTTAANGGGVRVATTGTGATASIIVNCTIVDNSALNANSGNTGGGVDAAPSGTLTLLNDTINGNFATSGGGVATALGTVNVQNSIIAQNAATNTGFDVLSNGAEFTSLGGNVIGVATGSGAFTMPTDQTGFKDVKLGPLQDNGGSTIGAPGMTRILPTEALLRGSPALGKAVALGAPAVDARGFKRPDVAGEQPDVGAFEFQAGVPNAFYFIKTDHSLWQSTASGTPILISPAGSILSISAVTDNAGFDDVFAVTSDHHVWEFSSVGWQMISAGSFQQLSAATATGGYPVVYAVGSDNSLWELGVSIAGGGQLLSPAGTVLSISAVTDAAGNSDVFAITGDHNLWEHTPAGWQRLSVGFFQQVSAGLNATGQAIVFGILGDNSIWENNPAFGGDGWQKLATTLQFTSISTGAADEVFAISSDHHLWDFKAGIGTMISAGNFHSISANQTADGQGEVFGVLSDASVWENNPVFPFDHWMNVIPAPMPGQPGVLAVAAPLRS